MRKWLGRLGTGTSCIEPGSPGEVCCRESFNGKLRDEGLNRQIFSLCRVRVVIDVQGVECDTLRPNMG